MTKAEFSRVLSELCGKTEYLYYHLMGEPLCHPDLPLFLRMASEAGFRSVLTTNGTLLAKRKQELLASPIHKVSVSLHSFEEGGEEQFLSYLSAVADFAQAASRKGIIVVLRMWNRGFDEGRNEKILAFFRERISGEWKENTKGIRIHDKLHLEWGDRFAWPDREAPLGEEEVFCYGLLDHFGVHCDGTVVPCCLDSEGDLRLGNLFEESLADILNTPRARAIAEGFAKHRASEELCRRCGYASRFLRK
jgi:radical SAM protein with 4Fe4S-binding SPASM domain